MSQFLAPNRFHPHRIHAAVAAVAARQHGVITTAQLHACGLSGSGIGDWVRAGGCTGSTEACTPSATAA